MSDRNRILKAATHKESLTDSEWILKHRPFLSEHDDPGTLAESIQGDKITRTSIETTHENPFKETPGNLTIFKTLKPIVFDDFSELNVAEIKTNENLSFRSRKTESVWSKNIKMDENNNKLVHSAPTILNSGERITLPILGCGRSDSIKRISSSTLASLIDDDLRSYLIVDARFPYEYKGGHIIDSVNFRSESGLMTHLLSNNEKPEILIFYCEFSSQRGPSLARRFRSLDRKLSQYPTLKYPEIYILKGGYKEFYENNQELTIPREYIPMNDRRFRSECLSESKRKNK